ADRRVVGWPAQAGVRGPRARPGGDAAAARRARRRGRQALRGRRHRATARTRRRGRGDPGVDPRPARPARPGRRSRPAHAQGAGTGPARGRAAAGQSRRGIRLGRSEAGGQLVNPIDYVVEPLGYEFMVRALITTVAAATVCAVLSCWLVLIGWSLMGDAVSHAVLPGVVLAYIAGLPFAVGAVVF